MPGITPVRPFLAARKPGLDNDADITGDQSLENAKNKIRKVQVDIEEEHMQT